MRISFGTLVDWFERINRLEKRNRGCISSTDTRQGSTGSEGFSRLCRQGVAMIGLFLLRPTLCQREQQLKRAPPRRRETPNGPRTRHPRKRSNGSRGELLSLLSFLSNALRIDFDKCLVYVTSSLYIPCNVALFVYRYTPVRSPPETPRLFVHVHMCIYTYILRRDIISS